MTVGVARAHEAADPGQGEVLFGFLRTLGASRAPELLRGYRLNHPRVRLALVQAAHEQLVAALHDGTVDVALSVVRATDSDVAAVEMFREPYVLVMSSGHRLSRHEFVRLRECRDESFVGLSPGIAMRRSVDDIFLAARVRPRYVFETEEVETVRGLATAGVGVAVLPARHGGPLSGSVEVPIAPRTYRHIGLLTSRRRTLEPPAEGFHRWVLTHAANGRGPADDERRNNHAIAATKARPEHLGGVDLCRDMPAATDSSSCIERKAGIGRSSRSLRCLMAGRS
jgi:DNA-binding transcriptional LysR family regulator